MKGSINHNFFLAGVFFLISLETPFIVAFSTTKCDHSEIEKHLKTTLNCIMKSQNKNMKAFLDLSHNEIASLKDGATNDTTAEWCELVDEEIACFTDNLGTCFNQKITDEFAVLMEWYYNKQPYMSCNRIEGLSKEEIENKAKDIVRNYKEDISSLKEMLKFDQQCSTDELVMSVKGKYPCFMMKFYAIIQEIMPHVIGPNPSEPKSFPICKNFVGLLNDCFGETSCLSQPEMNLLRDFLATYYNVAMGFVVQLTSKFGSMSNFMETMGVGSSDVHDLEGYPKLNKQMKKMMMKGMDLIVDDFKVSNSVKIFILLLRSLITDRKIAPKFQTECFAIQFHSITNHIKLFYNRSNHSILNTCQFNWKPKKCLQICNIPRRPIKYVRNAFIHP